MATDEPKVRQALFTDNNHWRFGWGNGLYNFQDQFLPLWVSYGPCRYTPKTFDIETSIAARKIADSTNKPIYVAMSGGLDSELVARTMMKEKIPFTPLIAQFENDYNKFDIDFAFDVCREYGLQPEVYKVNILDIFKSSAHTPYILANCASILYMDMIRYVHGLGGKVVFGAGEYRFKPSKNGKLVVPIPNERIATMNFIQDLGAEVAFPFYGYTPELMLCLIRESQEHGFLAMDEYSHNIKEYVYRKYWPNLKPRPKFHGFEEVNVQRQEAQAEMRKKHGFQQFEIPLDTLEQMLTAGKF
jgi:hypothetical protein